MKIIDFAPSFWFLLSDQNNFFMDVNCNYSSIGFSRLIKLNESEIITFQKKGTEYLNSLANDVQFYAFTKYNERNISGEIEKVVYETILKFNQENNFS